MTWKITIIAVAMASALLPAAAQDMPVMPPAACRAENVNLPPDLAGWSAPSDIHSAAQASGLDAATLAIGHAVTASLHPTREVAYVIQPEKPGGSVAHGGMLAVNIAEAGTYKVSLGSGAWIDVLKDGAAQRSGAHGHGPACSTIRKIVDFTLAPGRHVLQISANADPTIAVMVSRVP